MMLYVNTEDLKMQKYIIEGWIRELDPFEDAAHLMRSLFEFLEGLNDELTEKEICEVTIDD